MTEQVERFYCTRNRSGFSRALESATIRATENGFGFLVIADDDRACGVIREFDNVPDGWKIMGRVNASGEYTGAATN